MGRAEESSLCCRSDTDCTLLIACDIVPPKASEIQAKLEKTKVQDKVRPTAPASERVRASRFPLDRALATNAAATSDGSISEFCLGVCFGFC